MRLNTMSYYANFGISLVLVFVFAGRALLQNSSLFVYRRNKT